MLGVLLNPSDNPSEGSVTNFELLFIGVLFCEDLMISGLIFNDKFFSSFLLGMLPSPIIENFLRKFF